MANCFSGFRHQYAVRRMRIIPALLLWGLFFGFLLSGIPGIHPGRLYAEEPLPNQTPASSENVPDLSFYFSPVKMIRTQLSEILLNSQEWTDSFSGMVRRWDARHLHRNPASRLMMQLERTFPGNPRSLNDPLNLFFFNLQGMWGNFTLAEGMRPEPADPFLTFLSDFEPNEVAGLTAAFFDEWGYALQESPDAGIQRFGAEGKTPYYFGIYSPLKEDNGKSLFFLTRSPEQLALTQQEFPQSREIKTALSDTGSVFFILTLTGSGICKTAAMLEQRPEGSLAVKFAPSMRSLGDQIQSVWLVMQETSGQTQATLTFYCLRQNGPDELRRLFEESRAIFAEWAKDRTLSPKEALIADLVDRMELIQEDERVYIMFKLNAPETIEKIKQVLADKADKMP